MSDNEDSFAGSDSDNDSVFSDDGLVKTTNKLVGLKQPIKPHIKNNSDSDDDESIADASDLDEDEYPT